MNYSHRSSKINNMHPVIIHKYEETLTAIEFSDKQSIPENFVVFIGGVTDGFLTTPYIPKLAESIANRSRGNWTLVQALISSSYLGFGTGSLSRDAQELAKLVAYLRLQRGSQLSKVVLMGHSTGCQNTLQYLLKTSNLDSISALNGAILQAPVSDVEACEYLDTARQLPELMEIAEKLISEGRSSEFLPIKCFDLTFGAPTTAYRFHSLYSRGGDDDFFSSYIEDAALEATFGKIDVPLLVLQGGKDSAIPPWVDMKLLMSRWERHTSQWSHLSTIIPGADHNVGSGSDAGAVTSLVDIVLEFLFGDIH